MNIWLIQIGEPLPLDSGVRKLRTALIADKLVERGHSVVWCASAFEHQRKCLLFEKDSSVEVSERYTIRAFKGIGYARNVSIRRYLDHRFLARKFARFAVREDPPDLIVASTPSHDLAYEGVHYAKERNIPVVVDVRDLWPDIFLTRLGGLKKRIAAFLLAGDFDKLRYLLKNACGITAMSDGVLNWALEYSGRARNEADGVFHLGYKPVDTIDENLVGGAVGQILERLNSTKICVYVGTHGNSYELPLVIRAARKFARESIYNDVHFVIAGQGEQTDMLKEMSAGLSNVSFTGWLNSHEIACLMRRAYLGIVPCKSVNDAFPNKPIEYLSAGLPVVSSIQGEMADLVEEQGLGCNYLPGDVEGLFRGIKLIVEDEALHLKMSDSCTRVFRERFDADVLYSAYADYLENICNQGKGDKC